MAQADTGKIVRVEFTGRLNDGTVFDSSTHEAPLEFQVGEGQILPAFEREVVGMNPGEKKSFTVEAKDAFGQHRPELVRELDRAALEIDDDDLQVGTRLRAMTSEEQFIELTVTDLSGEKVTLDANHPLAGRDLYFEVQLLEVA